MVRVTRSPRGNRATAGKHDHTVGPHCRESQRDMSTIEKMDKAIAILREKGHSIGSGVVTWDGSGSPLLTVDDRLLTYREVYKLAGLPE